MPRTEMTFNLPNSERGIALTEALVAIAILGIACAALSVFLVNGKNQVRALKSMGVLEDYKNVLRSRIDCKASLSEIESRCKNAKFSSVTTVRLSDKLGATILHRSSSSNIVDRSWELRAICEEVGQYYEVKVQRRYIGDNDQLTGSKAWRDEFASIPIVCEKEAGWMAAWNQHCPSFCSSKGLTNVRSPDSYVFNWSGVNYPTIGSYCTSGELIPPSAQTDWFKGKFIYHASCWGGPCPNGSDARQGASVGGRCYGIFKSGLPQAQDNDSTDITAACYCE